MTKRKLYQTKNVLFYQEPVFTIMDWLVQLIEKHKDRYGVEPRKILMTEDQWRQYEVEVTEQSPQVASHYQVAGYPMITTFNKRVTSKRPGVPALHFRGIPIVVSGQWKRLLDRLK